MELTGLGYFLCHYPHVALSLNIIVGGELLCGLIKKGGQCVNESNDKT